MHIPPPTSHPETLEKDSKISLSWRHPYTLVFASLFSGENSLGTHKASYVDKVHLIDREKVCRATQKSRFSSRRVWCTSATGKNDLRATQNRDLEKFSKFEKSKKISKSQKFSKSKKISKSKNRKIFLSRNIENFFKIKKLKKISKSKNRKNFLSRNIENFFKIKKWWKFLMSKDIKNIYQIKT
jgi:hypothetical protein